MGHGTRMVGRLAGASANGRARRAAHCGDGLRAVADPTFNLNAIQTTTHPCTPLLIVNGPIAAALGISGGANALGNGHRANAVIGRAVRLVLQNIGGAVPGETDRATLGHSGKFTYCLAENETESPWPPL